ncbi:MAG: NAD(P)/FAD-dependent oxidoreductase [Burkholderiaceae bacterium]|nr:NAD(P)/FAD-dependent oxidoreductase [Burkholderiaceae bacterium]
MAQPDSAPEAPAARRRHDVLVVGASFAGVACAIQAARAGLRVVLIERKADVGEKLHTTGIVVKEAADEIERLGRLPPELIRPIRGVRLYGSKLGSVALDSPGYFFLATDTPKLMRWMVKQATDAGVDVRLRTLFAGAQREADGFAVADVGRVRFIVGADGPTSKVARTFGLGVNREFLFGIEAELTGVTLPEPERLHCFLDRRLARGYIGWAFDGVGVTQVGLALRQRRPGETPDLDAFLERLTQVFDLASINVVARRAGLIPVGGPVTPIAGDRVLLIGDAAGLVSPLTAGGIHTALESGRAAAVAIVTALAREGEGEGSRVVLATIDVPQFRIKRLLRRAFDLFQSDWLFDLLLTTGALRIAARLVYFHRRGLLSPAAWKELLRR